MVFVDLETTGANFANDRIIEIGVVEVDATGVREWSSLINPDTTVSPFITGLTGIDTAMVSSAPRFGDVAPLVFGKLRGRLFIAHNARFDYTFLKREFQRLGIGFQATSLCTVKLSRKLFPEHHRHSLDALVSRYEIIVGDRHRALADAKVLWDLWQRWQTMVPAERFAATIEAIVGKPELPPQLDRAVIDDLPEAPGAYALYDPHDRPLLVKRGTNIRQQVLAHFTPANRDTALVRNTCRIAWQEAAGELGARLIEHQLNAGSRKPTADLCAWQLIKRGEGDFRPQLVFAHDLDFATATDLFGLYASKREATTALRKLVEAQKLCHHHTGLGVSAPGEPCVGYKQRSCRGACIGKEPVSLHSARLMAALAKFKVTPWPYPGPVAVIERDEFGMREDFHLVNHWRYIGTAQNEQQLEDILGNRIDSGPGSAFDADIYRMLSKFLKAGKLRVLPLTRS